MSPDLSNFDYAAFDSFSAFQDRSIALATLRRRALTADTLDQIVIVHRTDPEVLSQVAAYPDLSWVENYTDVLDFLHSTGFETVLLTLARRHDLPEEFRVRLNNDPNPAISAESLSNDSRLLHEPRKVFAHPGAAARIVDPPRQVRIRSARP